MNKTHESARNLLCTMVHFHLQYQRLKIIFVQTVIKVRNIVEDIIFSRFFSKLSFSALFLNHSRSSKVFHNNNGDQGPLLLRLVKQK